jgi:leader peptidase (prepilin peptidase) / N-methyltransferase
VGSLEAFAHPSVFPWLSLAFGLMVGSFLNVVIHRLPKMMERDWQAQCAEMRGETPPAAAPFSLVRPRSRCPACDHPISAAENIPVLSYLVLRGRCSACKTPISLRYPVIELLSGLAAFYCANRYGFGLAAFAATGFVWAMIAASAIDFDTQLLPDSITLPLLWAGLLVNLSGTFANLSSAVIGAVAGYLALWTVYWLFKLATGKEGMGFGDFKLLAAIGAWTGWQMLPLVVLMSSFIGAAVGIGLIVLARHGRNIPIPFGPYLGAAGIVGLFWGQPITRYYLTNLLG